ncbi:efflux RND transporter permease subunit [Geotoga petraea]|uniref:SSD domain-containing protein n=1 Tax=Geotoga petraea TaxID=28234 RepID=A0A1G6KMT0_9BACT|nr:MMPL family transporter [Geotoga petraea]SDC32121.1 hypothetical protein SAMN04488588_0812 [Geotoga petraea]
MNKYTNFVAKNRVALIIFLILAVLLAILGINQIEVANDFNIFRVEGSEYEDNQKKMEKYFPATEQVSIMVEFEKKTLTMDIFQKMIQIQNKLEGISNIRAINGPAPDQIPIGTTLKNISNINENDLPQIVEYYNSYPALSPLVKKDDKIYAIYTIFPKDGFVLKQIKEIEGFLSENNYNYYASGDLYMQQKIGDYVTWILYFLPPAAFFLIFFVFRIKMGSLKSTFLAILPAGVAAVWTLGLIGVIEGNVSLITVLAPIFTIVIGSADGLHFVSHIQESRSEGYNKLDSISHTLKMVGIPMIITTITSIAGFMALLFMNIKAVNNLAIFSSIGIAFAGIATWLILPVILTGKIKLKKLKKSKTGVNSFIKRLWGKRSLAILIVLIIVSVILFPKIQNEFNLLMVYRENTDIYKSFNKFVEINGGSVPVFALLKADNTILSKDNADKILNYEKDLLETDSVNKVMSVYDIYSILNQKIYNRDKTVYPNQLQINLINTFINQLESNPIDNFLDLESNVARVIIFPNSLKNEDLKTIQEITEEYDDENVEIGLSGVQYYMYDLNKDMVKNQVGSLIIAFGLIIFLLWISLKKFIPALISLIPIASTVIILFGFLGLSGISLNLITTTIFSITLGVGIDYAVHFTSVWKSYKESGLNSEEAANKAYKYTSRPIIANALGLAVGVSSMLFSPLKIHVYISILMWVSMIAAVFLSLSVLPTILRKIK